MNTNYHTIELKCLKITIAEYTNKEEVYSIYQFEYEDEKPPFVIFQCKTLKSAVEGFKKYLNKKYSR